MSDFSGLKLHDVSPSRVLAIVLADLAVIAVSKDGARGVYVRDMPFIDTEYFCAAIASKLSSDVRFAFVSSSGTMVSVPNQFEVTNDAIIANKWRNDKRAGTVPLITIATGEVAKMNSIYDVHRPITSIDVRQGVARLVCAFHSNDVRNKMWDILAADPGNFTLPSLLDFAAECLKVKDFGPEFMSRSEFKALYKLGLLPLSVPQTEGIDNIMATNLKLVARLRAPDGNVRGKLVANAQRLKDATRANVAIIALRFGSNRDRTLLSQMPYEIIASILEEPENARPLPPNINSQLLLNAEAELSGIDGLQRHKTVPLDVAVAEALLSGSGGDDFFAKLEDGQLDVIDSGSGNEFVEITIGDRKLSAQRRAGSSELVSAMRQVSKEDAWGGSLFHLESENHVEALNALSREDVQPRINDPEAELEVAWFIRKLASEGHLQDSHVAAWVAYASARGLLLNYIDQLVDSPLSIAVGALTRPLMDELLSTYSRAMDAINDACECLRTTKSNPETANLLASKAIILDVLFVAYADGGRIAIAGPTHPFHIFRAVRYADIARDNAAEIRLMGDSLFKDIVANPRACFPNLILPESDRLKGERAYPFVAAGSIGALPLFTDPASRLAAQIESEAIAATVSKMFSAVPYTAEAMSVVVVDPPDGVAFLSGVLQASRHPKKYHPPIYARIFYTRSTERDSERMSEVVTEIERGGGHVRSYDLVGKGGNGYSLVSDALEDEPAHLTFVFDPGNGQLARAPADKLASLSPLVMPRHYIFNEYLNQFRVHIGGNAKHFEVYDKMYRGILNLDATQIISFASGITNEVRAMESISRGTAWLVVSDHGIEPTFTIPGTVRLELSGTGVRDTVIVATGDHCIRERCKDVLERAQIAPLEAIVDDTMRRMRQLCGDQMPLDAMLNRSGETITPGAAKALIGNLAVADFFRKKSPDCLVVSLDSAESRAWILSGMDSNGKRGDLLVFRPDSDGIILEVVEVKAWEFMTDDQVLSEALPQVQTMLQRLHSIFANGSKSPIAAARRDVLRDQVYRTLAIQGFSSTLNGRYARLLEDLFSGTIPTLSGSIFRVVVGDRAEIVKPFSGSWSHIERVGDKDIVVSYHVLQEGYTPSKAHSDGSKPDVISTTLVAASDSDSYSRFQHDLFSTFKEHDGVSPVIDIPPSVPDQVSQEVSSMDSTFKVFIGITPGGDHAFWDSEVTDDGQNNFGLMVSGDPGVGKTTLLKVLIADVHSHEIPALVFDFKNDYATKDFAGSLGIRVHDVFLNGLPFNPLRFQPSPENDLIDLGQAIDEFVKLVSTSSEGLGVQQQAKLTRAVELALIERGFPDDIGELIDPETSPEFPNFGEVLEILRRDPKGNQTVLGRISKLARYFRPQIGDETFDEIVGKSIILKLNGVPEDMKTLLSEAIVARLHGMLLRGDQPRRLTRLVVFDEAWRIGNSRKLAAIAREGRAFGVGCLIGTQYPGDIGLNLSGSLETKIFLCNREAEHRRSVISQFTLKGGKEQSDLDEQISQFRRGQGFIKSGVFKDRVPTVLQIIKMEDRISYGYPSYMVSPTISE